MSNALYNNHTGFQPYGLGTVAIDKKLGEWEIEVYPQERIPNTNKPLGQQDKQQGTFINALGIKQYYNEIKHNTITASWLPIGDYNRVTPPDVCQGETVMLWTSSGTDNIYWSIMFNQLDLRKTELALWSFSSKPQLVNPENVQDNTYSFLVDTLNQAIKLQTTKENGEATSYLIELLCKLGQFNIADGENNAISLDSVNGILNIAINKQIVSSTEIIQSSASSIMKLSGNNLVGINSDKIINLSCKENILCSADGNFVTKSKENTSINSDSECSIGSKEKMSITTEDELSIKADEKIEITGYNEITIDSDDSISITATSSLSTKSSGLSLTSNGEELVQTISTLVQNLETFATSLMSAFTTAVGNLGAPVEMADAVEAATNLNTSLAEVKTILSTIKGE